MYGMISILVLIATALAGLAATASLPQITAVGSKFFTADGDQFYIKG